MQNFNNYLIVYSDISHEGSNIILKFELICMNKNYEYDWVSNKFNEPSMHLRQIYMRTQMTQKQYGFAMNAERCFFFTVMLTIIRL